MKLKEELWLKLHNTIVYASTAIFSVICLIPFWLMVAGSITLENSILKNGYQMFPKEFSLQAYQMIFTGNRVWRSYLVTITVTVLGTLISIIVTSMLAYAISLKSVKFANQIAFFVFFTMLFTGGIVPWYILTSQYLKLGNTIWGLIFPYTVNAWFMFLMRNFFKGIPDSIMESGRIDGANDIRILFKIILPLSLPALATIGLFYSLQYWNDWWLALMLIDDEKMFPLQFLLRALVSNLMNAATSLNPNMKVLETPPAYSVRMATSVITIGPIILAYPFIQKYFVKGLAVGAVKG